MCRIQQIGNSLDAAACSGACHGMQNGRKLAVLRMLQHDGLDAAACDKIAYKRFWAELWVSQHALLSVTTCTTQCRGMRGKMKTRSEDRIEDAAAYYHGCRDMGPEAEKIKSLILIILLMYVGFLAKLS